LSTKIDHAVDWRGRPVRFIVTPGLTHDCAQGPALPDSFAARHVLADKAYDTNAILDAIEARGARPIVPQRSCLDRHRDFDAAI
jgi:transposase